ncbi:MAG: formate dehydrogenase accessory protein FdhE [Syntrophobacteraceae bacterium]
MACKNWWCATRWDLHRLQCPYCENRDHESLGYIGIEEEPRNRVVYCNICRFYFKQIDMRELAYAPYLPLEEWTTLHLDLLALKAGWGQPPSPAPAVYS